MLDQRFCFCLQRNEKGKGSRVEGRGEKKNWVRFVVVWAEGLKWSCLMWLVQWSWEMWLMECHVHVAWMWHVDLTKHRQSGCGRLGLAPRSSTAPSIIGADPQLVTSRSLLTYW